MANDRLSNILQLLDYEGLEALVLNPGPTLFYLTGLSFHLMERPVVLIIAGSGKPALVLPELELQKAKQSHFPLQTFSYNDNPDTWGKAFLDATVSLQLNGKIIGVEPTRLRYLELNYLENAMPDSGYLAADFTISRLRMQKDEEEIQAMRQAARIAQDALQATLPFVKPGVTEREIASELILQLLRHGSDAELPFQPIVSGGPNSADPHAVPSDRPLQEGDLLLFDWGAAYRGYISDITRTFAIGQVDPEFQKIASVVKDANAAGRAAGRPGIPAGQIDQITRAVIQEAGYGEYFTHRTGHGIGMEGHEPPYLFGENPLLLDVGMAYTVEPGIYFPGRGGVRIEDDMVITSHGSESLTDLPRELITIG